MSVIGKLSPYICPYILIGKLSPYIPSFVDGMIGVGSSMIPSPYNIPVIVGGEIVNQ